MDSNFGISKRSWSFTETMDGFRVIEIPFSPLTTPLTGKVDMIQDDLEFISPRDYGTRQAFLRSYAFTRADHPPTPPQVLEFEDDESKKKNHQSKSLLRLKAAAWAVVACQYRVPLRARLLKDKLVIKTSQYLSSGVHYLRSPPVPHCLMAGA